MENVDNKLYILHFILQDIRLCINLDSVKKILPLAFIQSIPNSPNYLTGIMNVAGVSVPVIDLSLRLNLRRKNTYTLNTPIILCQHGNRQIAIIIDEIIDLQQVDHQSIQMNKEFQSEKSPIIGVIPFYDDFILMLNTRLILNIKLTVKKNNEVLQLSQGRG